MTHVGQAKRDLLEPEVRNRKFKLFLRDADLGEVRPTYWDQQSKTKQRRTICLIPGCNLFLNLHFDIRVKKIHKLEAALLLGHEFFMCLYAFRVPNVH